MKGARQVKATSVRIPDELRACLKHAAIDNRRSFNDELVYRLEQSVRQGNRNADPRPA